MLRFMDAYSFLALTSTCSQLRSLRGETGAFLLGISSEEDCYNDRFRSRNSIQFVLWENESNEFLWDAKNAIQLSNEITCRHFPKYKAGEYSNGPIIGRINRYLFLAGTGATGNCDSLKTMISFWNLSTNKISRLHEVFENRKEMILRVLVSPVLYTRLGRYLKNYNFGSARRFEEIPMQVNLIFGEYVLKIKSTVYPVWKRDSYDGPRDNNDFGEPYLSFENTTFESVECTVVI